MYTKDWFLPSNIKVVYDANNNYICSLIVFMLFFLNRAASQISLGPLYVFDVLIVMALFSAPILLFKFAKQLPVLLLWVISICWLFHDMSMEHINPQLVLRRFAMSIYIVAPVLIVCFSTKIIEMYDRNSTVFILFFCIANLIGGKFLGTSVVVSCMLVASLVVMEIAFLGARPQNVILGILCFLLLVSGFQTSDGFYRTPILAFALALLVLFSASPVFEKIAGGVANRLLIVTFIGAITFVFAMSIEEIRAGVFGLLDWQKIVDNPGAFSSGSDRDRGDPGGTAATRVAFWSAILNDTLGSMQNFFFGRGHAISFFERYLPFPDFVDPERLEPHNSFFGIMYRYGFSGVLILLILIKKIALSQVVFADENISRKFRAAQLASAFLACTYAFFEVALEGPHGAFAFWFIALSPVVTLHYLNKKNS